MRAGKGMGSMYIPPTQRKLSSGQLKRMYDNCVELTEELGEKYKLSELECDVIRMARRIFHDLYMATEYPAHNQKNPQGGLTELS